MPRSFIFSAMKHIPALLLFALFAFTACNNHKEKDTSPTAEKTSSSTDQENAGAGGGHWKGQFSNGMKGARLSFDVEGQEVKELTFQGYWRCDGKLELTTLGPEESFSIKEGKVDGVVVEPKDGPAPFRFELHGSFHGEKAEGTLRISNVPAGCDTYKLDWTAEKE